ncbi:MAG: AAA family ATPase [Planctomycetota bacterium]
MHIENFKCFKDFDIELGPFNVLIGPNDSGKTAFLQAIRLAGAVPLDEWAKPVLLSQIGLGLGRDLVWKQDPEANIHLRIQKLGGQGKPEWPSVVVRSNPQMHIQATIEETPGAIPQVSRAREKLPEGWQKGWHQNALGEGGNYSGWRVGYYRMDPHALRQPSPVRDSILQMDGTGLASFLADLRLAPSRVFDELQNAFLQPPRHHYAGIRIAQRLIGMANFKNQGPKEVDCFVLKFALRDDGELPAEDVSDGVMLSLAYLALYYGENRPHILLIEEPENSVHHASLKEIIATLKDMAEKGTQVILTTHSPYLLDQVEPAEVRVFAKDEEGAVHAVNLAEYPDVEKLREQEFMTGEIWSMLEESKIVEKVRASGAGT